MSRHRTLLAALAVTVASPAAVAAQPHGGRPQVAGDVPVTAVNLSASRANNSPSMAVDPTDERFFVLASRVDAPSFGCALHVSGDGGRGWIPVNPAGNLPDGVERCYGPEVGFDAAGRLYYLYVGLRGAGNKPVGAYLTTSDNRGRSFSAPRRVLGENNFAVRMVIDQAAGGRGRIHLVWIAAGASTTTGGFATSAPNPILAAYSDDGGRAFSTPTQVSDSDRQRVVAPALAVGPDHAVHVLYMDLGDDARDYQGLDGPTWEENWALVMASSPDGRRFSTGVVVDDSVVPPERAMLIFTMPPPSLAAGPDRSVFAAWHDARNGDWDAFLRRSTDGGATWETPIRLNDDDVGNRRHQYQPKLDIAPSGRLDAVFYDRRSDPENLANQVSYTFSLDGGSTFAANRQVSELPSDPEIGARYPIPSAAGLVEFGSRLALASRDDAAVMAWTDTRNSQPGEQQDIFATEARFRSRPRQTEPDRGGGAAPVIAAIVGIALLATAAVVGTRLRRGRETADDAVTGEANDPVA